MLGVVAAVLGLHAGLMTALAPAPAQRLGQAADEAAQQLALRIPRRLRTVVVVPADQTADPARHPVAGLPASVVTQLAANAAAEAATEAAANAAAKRAANAATNAAAEATTEAAANAAAPRPVPLAAVPRVAAPGGSTERPLAAAPLLADAAPDAAASAGAASAGAASAAAAPAAAGLAVPAAAWLALTEDELRHPDSRHEPRLAPSQSDQASRPSPPGPPGDDDAAPPVYATRIPPPVYLRYALRYNGQAGQATLSWRHDGARYQLALEGLGATQALVVQTSQGGFDSAGLAPERFTDRRRGGPLQAANFRRDIGRIGFSGPAVDYPAWPGAQDRLSWLPQFVAIRSAAASAAGSIAAGAADAAQSTTRLFVVDARGGAALWHFQLEGDALLATALGPVITQRWRREPPRPEGLRVEAWLDAARGHWPVLLRFTALRSGDVFELRLRDEPSLPP